MKDKDRIVFLWNKRKFHILTLVIIALLGVFYISGKEGEFGFWGYGLFNEIALIGEGVSQTYEITIPNDKDYIVELIAEGMGIENAEYRE